MRIAVIITLALSGVALTGCEKTTEKSQSYSITSDDCSTGDVSYKTEAEFCEKIVDDELNNNCEPGARWEWYKKRCSTSTVLPNPQPEPLPEPQPEPQADGSQVKMQDICKSHYYTSDKADCLLKIKYLDVAEDLISICSEFYYPTDKVECLVKLDRVKVSKEVVQTCREHYYATDKRDCILKFK